MTYKEKYLTIKELWDDDSATIDDIIKRYNEIFYHIETIEGE
jgi:hypothetical protein